MSPWTTDGDEFFCIARSRKNPYVRPVPDEDVYSLRVKRDGERWISFVSVNGEHIHLSEHHSRLAAQRAAERAVQRGASIREYATTTRPVG